MSTALPARAGALVPMRRAPLVPEVLRSPPPHKEELTIHELGQLFQRHGLRGMAPSTLQTYKNYLGEFLDRFGDCTPSNLPVIEVLEWINGKTTWKSTSTLETALRAIKRLFNWSIRHELATRNPVRAIPSPAGQTRREWTEQEFLTIVRQSTARFRQFLYFASWCGARPHELRNLEWKDIDWRRHCIMLKQHKTLTLQREQRPRIIMLVPVAERLLHWLKNRSTSNLVFLNDHDQPWTGCNICRRIERIRKRFGLSKEIKPYGLRHRFATTAIRNGLELKSLSELLGHTTTKHTERYVHIAGDLSHLLAAAHQALCPKGGKE